MRLGQVLPVALVAVAVVGLLALFAQQPDVGRVGENLHIDTGRSVGGAQSPGGSGGGSPGGGALDGLPPDPPLGPLESAPLDLLRTLLNALGLGGLVPQRTVPAVDVQGFGNATGPEGNTPSDVRPPGQEQTPSSPDAMNPSPARPGESAPPGGGPQFPGLPDLGALGALQLPVDPWLLLVLLLIPLALAALLLARRRGLLARLRLPARAATNLEVPLAHTPGLDIAFAAIETDLPLVWGANDPELAFRLVSPPGALATLTCDGRACERMPRAPGSYLLEVRSGAARTQRRLRIVRYEDEVAADFNALAEATGVDRRDRTAREVLAEAQRWHPGLHPERAILEVFEAVEYDTTRVDRAAWVRYHRACGGAQATLDEPEAVALGPAAEGAPV